MDGIPRKLPTAHSQITRETKTHSPPIPTDTFDRKTIPKPRFSHLEATQKVQDKNIARMNAQVTIENIHARSTMTEGETRLTATLLNTSPVPRIMQTIKDLGKLADIHHLEQNFDQNGTLKEDKKNAITRLVTDEFAFYTKDKPLTTDEYHQLVQEIETMAAELSPNLNLVLASFPVLGTNNIVYNTVIHVQCGPRPRLYSFAKTSGPIGDPEYQGYLTQNSQDLLNLDLDKPVALLMPDNSGANFSMPYNSVVEVETAGGAKFYDAIDVCFDHYLGVAKRNLEQEIREKAKNLGDSQVPQQVHHTLTSSPQSFIPETTIGSSVFHADPDVASYTPAQTKKHQELSYKQKNLSAMQF